MNGDNGYTITCPKCGNEMNSNARYCMKCGYINTEHESNKSMKKYVKNVKTTYQVGSGDIITNNENNSGISIATNTGNKKLAFFVTYFIYLLIVVLSLYSTISNGVNSLDTLIISYFPIMLITISIMFLYIYSFELVFMKCNRPWWIGLIPIYNLIVLSDIVFHKKYIGILVLIPGINILFILIVLYKLGKKFNYNGILTVLFSFIFIPLMAYSHHVYEGKTYIEGGEKTLEKDYKLKKIFLTTIIIFIVVGIILYIMSNIGSVKKAGQLFGNSYYIMANKKMLKVVKNGVENNRINCKNGTYNEHTGVYYVYYADLGENMYLPLYMTRESIEAYVKIDNNVSDIKTKYYSSMSDGKYGFAETAEEVITLETVKEYPTLSYDQNAITCEIDYV